ncbi:MAG: methylamine utilization protein [Pseudohongiella nitratireducens]|nr:methylamine utilization protein [Pseudohongiella nitratireducens]MDF1622825.1 methylamine utilization protein [Pseudohongiella nitratireducens]
MSAPYIELEQMPFRFLFHYLLTIATFVSAFGISTAYGERLQVIDQDGNPVANAVVSFPSQGPVPVPELNAVIDQIDKQFAPHVLVVQKGQWVNFPNSDDIRHHVYSFSDPKTFEMRLFNGTDSEPQLFDQQGIVVLGCNIHDEMRGFIYVADQENTGVTDAGGYAEVQVNGSDFDVWHERLSASQTEKRTMSIDSLIDGSPRQVRITLVVDAQAEEDERTFRSRKFGND